MTKTVPIVLLALLAATTSWAQSGAQTAASEPTVIRSSSEKVRENPASQYMLIKTVVGKGIGGVNARALPVEAEGYNLLKYCWTTVNVLGDWAERAGLTGEMIVQALQTYSWQRDLTRAGYPEAAVAEAIGRYEAALVAAGFTEAARTRAVDGLVADLNGIKRTEPGAAQIRAIPRCGAHDRSLGLNHTTQPEGGRVQFIPYLLHQLCAAQQLDPDDTVRCDYWMTAKPEGPMSFAGEMAYSVRWPDGAVATGRFDPDALRNVGSVTLRLRPPHPAGK
jgi:hypothetical protein